MPKMIDITGQKFGRLTVLERCEDHILPNGKPRTMWLCECECGNKTKVSSQSLRQRKATSCGCYHKEVFKKPTKDMTGLTFGKLKVIEQAPTRITDSGQHKIMWKCSCECGSTTIVEGWQLRNGRTQSCGCVKSRMEESIAKFLKTYGVNFAKEKSFPDLKTPKGGSAYFDFAVYNDDKLYCLIEAQGIQHYIEEKGAPEFGKYEREVTDILKKEYCKKNNIPLIEISYLDNIEYEMLSFLVELYANTVPSAI